MQRLPAALAILLALASPLVAAEIETAPNGSYTGRSFGNLGKEEIVVFAGVHEMQGRVAVCGMVVNMARSGALRANEAEVVRQLQFRVAGQKLIVATRNFNRLATLDEAKTAKAGCSITRTPWQPAYAGKELAMDAGRVTYSD